MYIIYITVNWTAEFDLFSLLNTVPSRNEAFDFASAEVGSPLSRYQNAFVRCDVAASLPFVNMVSKNEL